MVKDKLSKYRNKYNRLNDAEIMVVLLLFHFGSF